MDLTEAAVLARMLFKRHGLSDWKFDFDRSVTRLGCCRYDTKTISLSYILTERATFREVVNVLLHEIAHAQVGSGHGHNEVWRAAARRIGCTGARCYDNSQVDAVPGRWQAVCPGCGNRFHLHRERAAMRKRFCRACDRIRGQLTFKEV